MHPGVKTAYLASVKARGIVEGARGELEPVVRTALRSGPMRALTFGSLCEAFYAALADEPEYKNLRNTLETLLECRILHRSTPPSILKHLINLHNRFHAGAGTSFVELALT